MDLTALRVCDARREIAAVDAVDITNPDLSRPALVALVTRLAETLRITTDHAERLGQSVDTLRAKTVELGAETAELESQVRALHEAAAQTAA